MRLKMRKATLPGTSFNPRLVSDSAFITAPSEIKKPVM